MRWHAVHTELHNWSMLEAECTVIRQQRPRIIQLTVSPQYTFISTLKFRKLRPGRAISIAVATDGALSMQFSCVYFYTVLG